MTIWPFIFLTKFAGSSPRIVRHEKIHLAQQRELGVVGFFPVYLWYYTKGKFCGMSHDESYRAIPFEREAYVVSAESYLRHHHNDKFEDYLSKRERNAWTKYVVEYPHD